MVDQDLARISEGLVYSAMLVYTGAFAAFAYDLSLRGRLAARPAREPVTAGSSLGGSGEGEVGGGGAAVAVAVGPPAGPGPVAPAHSRAVGIAVALTVLAFGLHAGGVVARGLSAGRAPWGNMYEFSVSGACVVTGVYLAVLLRRDLRWLGTFVVGPVLLTLGLAVTVLYTAAAPLMPALQSFWLVIHVSIAFIASALLTLGFSVSVVQLLQERLEAARAAGRTPRGRFMAALPTAAELERLAYRLHVIAFPLWTFTVIAGAIWAEKAWGRYWGWDPKEVWAFISWVVYAGYLHARATPSVKRNVATWIALLGFATMLMNLFGVNLFFSGFHSYANAGGM
jgi:cytochrome c-type biogenesis protein CcsB